MSKPYRYGSLLLLAIVLLLIWAFVLPPQLGGRTMFLTTRGVSMEPLLHQDDLVMLKKQSRYKVDDVVHYQSKTLNAPVLHRIIAVDGNAVTTKGDANDWIDSDHPKQSEINGKMVQHWDGAGRYLAWLKSTPVRILGALAIGWAVYGALSGNEKRRRVIPRAPQSTSQIGDLARKSWQMPTLQIAVVFGVITLISGVVAAFAFSQPLKTAEDEMMIYNMSGRFAYSGHGAPGSDLIYADGQVSTGDPIYLSLVDEIFISFTFEMISSSQYKGSGELSMKAVINGKSGWTHDVPLGDKIHFTDDEVRTGAVVDLDYLRSLVSQINALTRLGDTTYTVSIEPVVQLDGKLGGQPFTTSYAPALQLQADGTMLRVVESSKSVTPTAGPRDEAATEVMTGLNTSKGGTIALPAGGPIKLQAFGATMAVATLRLFAVAGLLVGLLGLAFVGLAYQRREQHREASEDLDAKRYRELLVPVSSLETAHDATVIDMPSLRDLARVADQHESLILHQDGDEPVYVVNSGRTTYRYLQRGRTDEEVTR